MTTPESNSSPKPRRSLLLKWTMAGCMFLFVLIFLPLACLVAPEYLHAGQAPLPLQDNLALLEPAGNTATGTDIKNPSKAQAHTRETGSTREPANTSGSLARQASAVSSSSTHRLKFKPFIDADSKWGKKLGKNRDQLNARFDAILVRIANYEAAQGSMDWQTAQWEQEKIVGEFQNVAGEMLKRLGLSSGFIYDGSYLSQRLAEYYQWQMSSQARIWDREGQFERAALYTREMLATQKAQWSWSRKENPHNTPHATWSAFYREPEIQALWAQEKAYWRKAGGLTGWKELTRSVLDQKIMELNDIFRNVR